MGLMGISPRMRGKLVTGLLLVLVGAMLLADNLDLIEIDFRNLIATYWPLVLVVIGIGHMVDRKTRSGMVFFAGGVLLQLAVLGLLDRWTLRRWWPVLLVAVGVTMVLRSYRRSGGGGSD